MSKMTYSIVAKLPNVAQSGSMTFAWFISKVFRKMEPKHTKVMSGRCGQEHDFCIPGLQIEKIEKKHA
jgi:hypothetical protein